MCDANTRAKKKAADKTLNNRAKNIDSIYYCINLPLFRLLNKLNVIKKFLLMTSAYIVDEWCQFAYAFRSKFTHKKVTPTNDSIASNQLFSRNVRVVVCNR